jgi:hypothetical protein
MVERVCGATWTSTWSSRSKTEVSSWLMCLKAEALCEAGIIDTDEMSAVLERAAAVLDQAPKQAA